MNASDAKRRRYWKKIDERTAERSAIITEAATDGDTTVLLAACAALLNDVAAALIRIQYDLNEERHERERRAASGGEHAP